MLFNLHLCISEFTYVYIFLKSLQSFMSYVSLFMKTIRINQYPLINLSTLHYVISCYHCSAPVVKWNKNRLLDKYCTIHPHARTRTHAHNTHMHPRARVNPMLVMSDNFVIDISHNTKHSYDLLVWFFFSESAEQQFI